MNSTIMVQKSVKDIAAQKAKAEGVSLSTVVKFLLKGYSEGQVNIGLVVEDGVRITEVEKISVDPATQSLLNSSVKKWRHKFTQ